MSRILQKLEGGDLRSIGRAEEVAQDILADPSLFGEVFAVKHPEYLQPFKARLIEEVSRVNQQEVRWHVAQMFSRLELNGTERDAVMQILLAYLDTDESRIVKVFSIQTLAALAEKDTGIRPRVIGKLKEFARTGSPAMVNRARKLLARIDRL
jgi:hypothetical protein